MSRNTEKRYFDDEEFSKENLKILFLPGRNLQSRELIEIQNVVLNQISRFGYHVFKEGSPVYGGDLSYGDTNIIYVNVPSGIDISFFEGKEVIEKNSVGAETGCRAYVKSVGRHEKSGKDYLEVEYISFNEFSPSNRVYIDGVNYYLEIQDDIDSVKKIQYAHVQNGVYFLNGYFVEVPEQRIIIEEGDLASGKLGFLYNEVIVTEDNDERLYDPAFGSVNYSAPGAHRLRYDVKLSFISHDDVVPENFIEIVRIKEGEVETIENNPIYNEIGEALARRTYAESGDYTIEPFRIAFEEDTNVLAEWINVSSSGSYFVANVHTTIPHFLEKGKKVKIVVDGGSEFDGVWEVNDVLDKNTFNFVLDSLPSVSSLDGAERKIRVSGIDNFVVFVGPGSAVVKGFSITQRTGTRVFNRRARDTRTQQNHSVGIEYGNVIYLTNASGYLRPNESVTLRNSANAAIGSAVIRYVKVSDTSYSSSSRLEASLYNFEFVNNASISDVKKITSQNASFDVHSDSIDSSGKTFLRGKNVPLLYRVRDYTKSIESNGVSDTSFMFYKYMSNNSSNGEIHFHLSGNDEFQGLTTNFVNTSFWSENYLLTNSSGNVVQPQSVVLDSSRKILTVTISVDDTYHLLANVRKTVAYSKAKRLKEMTLVISPSDFQNGIASLTVPDVYRILEITDTNGVDVSNEYVLDNGQRDIVYLISSIKRKSGQAPSGQITVRFEYFEHSGVGFFSVDSYKGMEISDIPIFRASDGREYKLSDYIDFRPVVYSLNALPDGVVPANGSNLICDVDYYVGRYDRIVLTKYGEILVVRGISSDNPKIPDEPQDTMTLYHIYVPPYTETVDKIRPKYYDNKRYTMRDIGSIDRRLKRVENAVSLSLLEMRVKQEPIYDSNGLERFKNGFIVDDFSSFGIADIKNPDFSVSFDFSKNEMRPSFDQKHMKLNFNGNITNAVLFGTETNGYMYGLPYEEEVFLENVSASKSEFVNKFSVIQFVGEMELNPPFDDWYDDTERDVIIELGEDGSSVESVEYPSSFSYGSWNNYWYGQSESADDSVTVSWSDRKLVNVNFEKWIRPIDITVRAFGLRPNTELYVFMGGDRMDGQVTPLSGFEPQTGGMVRSDENGEVKFVIHVKNRQFRTGKKVIVVCDEQSLVLENASTFARGDFYSTGIVRSFVNTEITLNMPRPQIINNYSYNYSYNYGGGYLEGNGGGTCDGIGYGPDSNDYNDCDDNW